MTPRKIVATDHAGVLTEFWVHAIDTLRGSIIEYRVTSVPDPSCEELCARGWFTLRIKPLDKNYHGRPSYEIDWIGVDAGTESCGARFLKKGLPESLMKWATGDGDLELFSSTTPSEPALRMWERLAEQGQAEQVDEFPGRFRFIRG